MSKQLNRIENQINKLVGFAEIDRYQSEVLQYSVAEWVNLWRDMYKVNTVKEGTLYHLDLLLKKYIIPTFGSYKLEELQPLKIQTFFMKVTAPRLRQQLYCTLNDIFTKAFSLKLIAFNPMCGITIPTYHKKESIALNREQQEKFVTACQTNKYGNLFLIMLYAGLRRGEALALTYADIDLEKNVLHITKTVNDLNHINSPKTRTSVRDVPIFAPLRPHLQKYALISSKRLFPIAREIARRHFLLVLEKSELLGLGITMHSLRHTFATRCCELNVNVKATQKWLGHATAQMTMNIYSHCNADFELEQIEKINGRFSDNYNQG